LPLLLRLRALMLHPSVIHAAVFRGRQLCGSWNLP
jgi:hypothetical protein